jgi:hypothetical protein
MLKVQGFRADTSAPPIPSESGPFCCITYQQPARSPYQLISGIAFRAENWPSRSRANADIQKFPLCPVESFSEKFDLTAGQFLWEVAPDDRSAELVQNELDAHILASE